MKGFIYFLQVITALLRSINVMTETQRKINEEHERQRRRDAHDALQAELLIERIRTQSARTAQVENQAVLTELKIERERTAQGLNREEFKPSNYE